MYKRQIYGHLPKNWAKFIHDQIKGFWTQHRRSIVYAPYIMRILQGLGLPSYLSQHEEIPTKDSGPRYLSLMHLHKSPPRIIPFNQWTQQQQQQEHHGPPPTSAPQQTYSPHPLQHPPSSSHATEYYSDSEIQEARVEPTQNESLRDLAIKTKK